VQLKPLPKASVPAALAKAERYRLLNDPSAAESICRDILLVEPTHQAALEMLILALADQFQDVAHRVTPQQPIALLAQLEGEYAQRYYHGIIHERWGKALLSRGVTGADRRAYQYLREAMQQYESALAVHPAGNDDAILRWNSCVRCIEANGLGDTAQDDDARDPYHD
jgi:hypothetical protein